MSQIRTTGIYLWICLGLNILIGCEEPAIPVNELDPDAAIGGIGPITIVGGNSRAGDELGGDLIEPSSGMENAGSSGIEAGVEAGVEAGEGLSAWEMSSCSSDPSPVTMVDTGLASLEASTRWSVGGPIGPGALLVNPRSDTLDQYQLISLIGGRVEMRDERGSLIWQTEVSEALSLEGTYDFDGDGALEVVVRSRARVHLLSVANGLELWSSDPQFVSEIEPITSVSRVIVDQTSEEPLPYLYIADSGCSNAGTGYGVIYRFPIGFSEAMVQPITEPRLAGRCARWHTLSRRRTDASEDLVEVMITDSKGLHAFDTSTGIRTLCGALAGMPPAGELPYKRVTTESGPGWFAFLPNELALLTPQSRSEDTPDESHCASQEVVLKPKWRIPLNGLTPFGSVHLDHNNDGVDDLWVNAWLPESEDPTSSPQRTALLIDGTSGNLIAVSPRLAVLGVYHISAPQEDSREAAFLIAEDPDPQQSLERSWFSVQLAQFRLPSHSSIDSTPVRLDPTRLWSEAIDAVQPLWSKSRVSDTSEHLRLTLFDSDTGTKLALKRDLRLRDLADSESHSDVEKPLKLTLVDAEGVSQSLSFGTRWGAFLPICPKTGGCLLPQRLALSLPSGQVDVYESSSLDSMALGADEPISISTGKVSIALSADDPTREAYLVTQSTSGQLTAYQLPARRDGRTPLSSSASVALLWSRSASQHGRPESDYPTQPLIASPPRDPEQVSPYEDRVVVTYDRRNPTYSSWVGYDLISGEERWRHQLFAPQWRTEEQTLFATLNIADQQHDVVFRLERMLDPDALGMLPECEGEVHTYTQGDLFAPYEACPEFQVTPRVIHALEATTGRCLWRTTVRERNGCARPSLQYLSLADVDGDGQDELYLLESDSIRQIDPTRGTHERSALIPRRPDQRLIAGGWLKAHLGGLLRFGTYSPPDLYQPLSPTSLFSSPESLNTFWFGQSVSGLRNQSWLTRWAGVTEAGVWLTLGVTYPLALFNEAGQITELKQLVLDAESEFGVMVRSLDVSDYFAISPEITSLQEREGQGLIATTREGGLFILNQSAELEWGRKLRATPSLPLFVDWDRDGEEEWILTTSDGNLAFYDQQGYSGLPHLWEAGCDVASTCSTAEDIDELEVGRSLCVAWSPLDGSAGVEIQLQTINGTALTEWSEPYEGERAIFTQLQLTPGNRYRVAARVRIIDGQGALNYTETTYSDGFVATDDLPPEAMLSLSPETIDVTSASTEDEERSITISLSATDGIGISGWSLVMYSEDGRFVRVINSSAASGQELSREEEWDGRDRYQRYVEPGRYLLVFGVTDTGGNQINVETWVTAL